MARIRSLLAGALLFVISTLSTLLVVEVVLRAGLLSPSAPRDTMVRDRARSPMEEPDFRQPGFALQPKEDTFRIVVLGDSFSWGVGVYWQDAFPHRLQSRLAGDESGPRFEVVPWTRPGWNTVREVRSLERRLDLLAPDLVILAFVLNDPEPTDRTRLQQMLAAASPRMPKEGLSSWLFAHSRLYALIWSRVENSRSHRALGSFYRSLFEGEHWQECLRALRRLRNKTSQRDIPLMLAIFPVFDSPMDERYPYLDLHAKIRQEGRALGLPVLDLFEVYQGMDTARLAVVPFTNAHPTEIAHRIAADALVDYLARKRLIPFSDDRPRGRKRRKPAGE